MKYIISLFFTLNLWASPIRIFHEGNSLEANMLKDILMIDYKVPDELILIRQIKLCKGMKPEGKIDLCLKNNGDLYTVSVDYEFVNESLKVFQAP